jgi:hypothetical protein
MQPDAAFELLRTELLQRQRDATISWSGAPSLTTDLSAALFLFTGAPRIQPPSPSEPVPSERDDHTKHRGLGVGLVALLPAGSEEFAYILGVRQHEEYPLLVAESRYTEQPTGQRRTLEQPFPHQVGVTDLRQLTTTDIIQHVLSAYRAHLERTRE